MEGPRRAVGRRGPCVTPCTGRTCRYIPLVQVYTARAMGIALAPWCPYPPRVRELTVKWPSIVVLVQDLTRRRRELGRLRRLVLVVVELDGDGLEHAPEPVRAVRVRRAAPWIIPRVSPYVSSLKATETFSDLVRRLLRRGLSLQPWRSRRRARVRRHDECSAQRLACDATRVLVITRTVHGTRSKAPCKDGALGESGVVPLSRQLMAWQVGS